MTYMKAGSPFLYDELTGDVVGIKDIDGGETMLVTAQTDPLTGGIELSGGVHLPYIAALSAVPVSLTGTALETTLANIPLPPLGLNDAVRVSLNWSFTSSVNLKTMFAKLNGATFAQNSTSTSGHTAARMEVMVTNRNNTASQLGCVFGSGFTSGAAVTFLNPAVETSGNNNALTIRAQLASAGETITLEGYMVELIRRGT